MIAIIVFFNLQTIGFSGGVYMSPKDFSTGNMLLAYDGGADCW